MEELKLVARIALLKTERQKTKELFVNLKDNWENFIKVNNLYICVNSYIIGKTGHDKCKDVSSNLTWRSLIPCNMNIGGLSSYLVRTRFMVAAPMAEGTLGISYK